jgi:hypothetical protein
MADRPTNRPRRAFGADDPTPEQPRPDAGATGDARTPEQDAGTPPQDAGTTGTGPAADRPAGAGVLGGAAGGAEDEVRPIFREAAPDADAATVRTPATDASSADTPVQDGTGTTRAPRLSFAPRVRPAEDDETTVLPRTGAGADRTPEPDEIGDDLDDRPRRLGHRARLALLIGAVAAVVIVGLAVGYAVVGVHGQPSAGGDPTQPVASTGAPTPSATALLDDSSMLAPTGAQAIDPRRTWAAGATTRGPVPDGSGAACLGSDPLEGAPTSQQTITRTLTANGSDAPAATHVAQAYATAEDATQAFAVTSRALASCAVPGNWLFSGRVVQGLGDESTAVAVHSVADGDRTQHWVVASRTGRVLDVVDASTPGKKALDVNKVTSAVASVVTGQCGPAGGTCATTVSTKDGPPPVGGDEPGFLNVGDLPPVGSTTAPWVGTPVEPPSADFTGSQCESVTWSTTAATSTSSRVYLLQDVPGIFGLNEISLTVKDAATASKLVDKIRGDWSSCKERKLTATVDSPTKVTGVAADGAAVTGWTTVVEQKAGSTVTRFRVGIASSGDKVTFVFLNPQKGLDVDGDDWNVVAVRAVQRATQES